MKAIYLLSFPLFCLLFGCQHATPNAAFIEKIEKQSQNIQQFEERASLNQQFTNEKWNHNQQHWLLCFDQDKGLEGKRITSSEEHPSTLLRVKNQPDTTFFAENDQKWQITTHPQSQIEAVYPLTYRQFIDLFKTLDSQGQWLHTPTESTWQFQGKNKSLHSLLNTLTEKDYISDVIHTLHFSFNRKTGYLTHITWQAQGTERLSNQPLTTHFELQFSGINQLHLPNSFANLTPIERQEASTL